MVIVDLRVNIFEPGRLLQQEVDKFPLPNFFYDPKKQQELIRKGKPCTLIQLIICLNEIIRSQALLILMIHIKIIENNLHQFLLLRRFQLHIQKYLYQASHKGIIVSLSLQEIF